MNEITFIYDGKKLVSYPNDLKNMSGSFKFEIIMMLLKSTATNYKNRGQSKEEYIEKISDFTIKHVLKTADEIWSK